MLLGEYRIDNPIVHALRNLARLLVSRPRPQRKTNFAHTHLPFWLCIAPSKVISMTMTAQEYRANARQCLSWAESARDPENREAFLALAATWISAAARIEHAARIERSTAAQGIRATDEPSLHRAAAG
jgi:hypothetical protein